MESIARIILVFYLIHVDRGPLSSGWPFEPFTCASARWLVFS